MDTGESEGHCNGTRGAAVGEHNERVDQCIVCNLTGLAEAHAKDPGARFVVMPRKLEMMQK